MENGCNFYDWSSSAAIIFGCTMVVISNTSKICDYWDILENQGSILRTNISL